MRYLILIILSLIQVSVRCDCAFIVQDDLKPQPPKPEEVKPFLIDYSSCSEWIGKEGCCNYNSFRQTSSSFGKLDTVFGTNGGGCDVCAINLKRFWCTYSCGPNQADYVEVQFIVKIGLRLRMGRFD
jgi:hypothetical protein